MLRESCGFSVSTSQTDGADSQNRWDVRDGVVLEGDGSAWWSSDPRQHKETAKVEYILQRDRSSRR